MKERSCMNCQHFYLNVDRTDNSGFCRVESPITHQALATDGYLEVHPDNLCGQWVGNGTCAQSMIRIGSYVSLKGKPDAYNKKATPRVVAIAKERYHVSVQPETVFTTYGDACATNTNHCHVTQEKYEDITKAPPRFAVNDIVFLREAMYGYNGVGNHYSHIAGTPGQIVEVCMDDFTGHLRGYDVLIGKRSQTGPPPYVFERNTRIYLTEEQLSAEPPT